MSQINRFILEGEAPYSYRYHESKGKDKPIHGPCIASQNMKINGTAHQEPRYQIRQVIGTITVTN